MYITLQMVPILAIFNPGLGKIVVTYPYAHTQTQHFEPQNTETFLFGQPHIPLSQYVTVY